MDKSRIEALAAALFSAQQARTPIAPLTEQSPGLTIADAYTIQMENVRRMLAAGEKISGKKIGLTSPGIQKQLGVGEPDYGHLFQNMECAREVPSDELLQPKIEAEIAFVLKEDLSGGRVTPEDVRRATDYIVCAFEIVDSRVENWRIRLIDTVADNASSGRYVLGTKRVPLAALDLSAIEMKMYKEGEGLVGEGTGAAVLGDPCRSVAWLANCLNQYGVPLRRGETILSGAFSAAPAAKKGDAFKAEFAVLGGVEARFL